MLCVNWHDPPRHFSDPSREKSCGRRKCNLRNVVLRHHIVAAEMQRGSHGPDRDFFLE
jgi:hypothetical protein